MDDLLLDLKEVVADAQQTLMVLDKEGAILTRIWCLYEVSAVIRGTDPNGVG